MSHIILVPASGSSTDEHVFATALAMAKPLQSHLDFYHLRLSTSEAMVRTPHADFCMGSAIRATAQWVDARQDSLGQAARRHVTEYCELHAIAMVQGAARRETVTASYTETACGQPGQLLQRARHRDFTVVGRPHNLDYMPVGLIEDLIVGCGRPIVLASEQAPTQLDTIVIGWKECAEAARAIGVAMPLLLTAKRVMVVCVTEDAHNDPQSHELVDTLAWSGVKAHLVTLEEKRGMAAIALDSFVESEGGDLLIIGGFSRGVTREMLFGGVTQSFVDEAKFPVLVMH